MKFAKRLLALAAGILLMCPVTAYAAPSETATDALERVMEQQAAVDSINAFYDFDLNMSGSMMEELGTDSLSMRMEMNVKMSGLKDPSQMKYMTYYRITAPGGEQMTGSTYYVGGYMYTDSLGMKYRYPMDMTDAMTQAMSVSDPVGASMEYIKDVSLRPEGKNAVIDYTMNTFKINDLVRQVLDSAGMAGMTDAMTFGIDSARGSYVINPDGLCEKQYMSMIMGMSMDGEDLRMTIDGDIGIADPGQPVEVPMPNPAEYQEMALY